MKDQELLDLWKSQDKKLEEVLTLNKAIAYELTKTKLHKTIKSLLVPKSTLLVMEIPYTLILCFITWITFKEEAYIMMFGFGMISLIMLVTTLGYFYHLFLIAKISRADKITEVQKGIASLKISSFNMARLAILQLPYWAVCWVSIKALKDSPFVYGGVNLLVILGLTYISYRLYQNLGVDKDQSRVGKILLSGKEWEPILKSADILEQLKEYES